MLHQTKKLLTTFLIAIFAVAALTGCGGPKVSPEESIKIVADAAIKLDFSQANKLQYISKQEQENLVDSAKKQSKNMIVAMGRSAKVKISDADAGKIVDAILEVQKKATVTTKLISKEDTSAVVELTLTHVDSEKFMEAYMGNLMTKLQGFTQQDFTTNGGAIITESFLNALQKAEFSTEPFVVKTKCVLDKKANEWIPAENAAVFGQKLGMAVWGTPME